MEVMHYVSSNGRDQFDDWLDRIRDRRTLTAIFRRIGRIERHGVFGDHRYLRAGVSELRVDLGPGYRVYFSLVTPTTVLLIHGGDKRRQDRDIELAIRRLVDYRRRST